MKLKQFIFALVAMLLCFVSPIFAQTEGTTDDVEAAALFGDDEFYVNCDYNSSTSGWGTTKFSNYDGAFAKAKSFTGAKYRSATIIIEKTNTLSGNCLADEHDGYTKLAVIVKDGATIGVAISKWDMTYPVTVEPGGAIVSARSKNAGYINSHIKNTLTIGSKNSDKKAVLDFLGGSYQSGSVSIMYNGKIVAENATIEVGDFGLSGTGTFNNCDITVGGVLATGKNNNYKQTITNTTVTVGGVNYQNENTYYSTEGTLLHNLTLDNSTIAVGEGDGVVVKTVTLKNGSSWTVAEGANVNTTNAKVTVYGSVEVPEELANNSTANELVSNTAVSGYTPKLPTGVTNLTVELTKVEATSEETTKVTFNVEPKNASGNKVSETSEITFRLPVPAAWAGKKVVVYHDGTALSGIYTVQSGNYVEVTSTSFSEFAVELFSPVAKIGNKVYDNFEKALAAAQAGDVVELCADVTATQVIMIDKSVTINGNGHKVTSSANRVFRVTAAAEVTLNNVNMVSTAFSSYTSDIRGISLDGGVQGVIKLTLNNCSVDFDPQSGSDWAYAVNISGNSSGYTLAINGGTYEGANVINVWGDNHVITIDGATLNNLYNAPQNGYYGQCVRFEGTGCNTTIKNTVFNGEHAITVGELNSGANTVVAQENNTDNTKRYIVKVGTEYYYTFADAFAAAVENGETIEVRNSFAIDSETFTVAKGKNVTLDLSGCKITVTDNKAGNNTQANYELFYILGEMTVTGNGTIELTATNNREWNASSSIFHNRGGVLNVENGTFKHLGGTDMAYVIDNSGNWAPDATTNVKGGEIASSYIGIRNRMDMSDNSGKAILNVSGGKISGTKRAIWAQASSSSEAAPAKGEINVSGGEVGLIETARNATAKSMTTVTGGTVVAFKGEAGELKVTTGGTVATVTIYDAAGNEIAYAVNSEGLYVAVTDVADSGTWGGIDWSLTYDGTLTIAPTKGTPTTDNSGKWSYEVGQWPEAVKYNNKGVGVDVGLWPYDRTKVKTLIIEEGVTSIGSFTAQSFTNLTGEVVIPYTVKYIGQEAFQKSTMTKLTFAPVPEGKTGEELCIAQGALKQLAVEEITFPEDRPVHLHAWLIAKCANLKHITLPATIKSINGTRHVDYQHNPNVTNGGGDNTSAIISDCPLLEDITFGSQEVRDLYYNPGWTRIDAPMVVNVGLKSYRDFRAGIDAAKDGETVLLLGNVTLEDTWTIPAGMNLTLNLNGKTISQTKACTASYEMINNKGNLNIVGSGKISFTDTGAGDPNFGWGSYTVRNEGDLVVEKATIEHKGAQAFGTHCIMAIYQYSGSTTINGGTISTPNYRSARLWKGDMTINGGTFDGQVWVQAVDNTAKLTVNGGTFEPNGNDASAVFVTNSDHDVQLAVANGTFNGKIGCSDATKLAGCVTGGSFNEAAKANTNAALIATGYVFGEANAEGYYAVEDDPATHYIASLEDLKAFRDDVNTGRNSYAGVTVYLAADIDLAGEEWSPIGTFDYSFDGNFDGQGRVIKNLKITDNTAAKGEAYLGFFGVTANNVIKNFVIENVTIESTGQIVAAAIAYPYYTTVADITVRGDIAIKGGNYTAGVLAYTRLCQNASNLAVVGNEGSYISGAQVVGGVIADIQMNKGLVANYSNFSAEGVTISGTKNVGGISGIIATQTLNGATVKNVTLNSGNAGVGIVAGCLGGTSTISNVTYENVTGASTLLGNTYDGTAIEAKIGNTYYATLDAALATEGEATVELLVPVTVATGESRVIELNGKTVIGTDNATGSFALININPEAELTINGEGAIKLTATNNRGWNAYSSVISNQRGKLTVNGGTIEHLGGTDMAYAIDNLTNTGAQKAETVINGGTVKSTYRAIRQFLNSTSAQNVLTVNGGAIEGANKSIWMQGANANANPGALTVEAAAAIKGDVYLTTAAGTAEYPVVVAVAADALKDGAQVLTSNVPAEYTLANVDGVWSNVAAAAAINGKGYATFAAAVEAAQKGATIVLLQDVNVGSITIEKSLTIDGAGKTITGHIHANLGNTKMTVKNVNFNGDNATYDYAIRVDRASSFVAENCTADGYKYSFLYANKSNNNFTIKDVTVTNCANYGVYFASFNNATIENLTVIGAEYGVAAGNAANSKVNIKNSTFDVELPLYIQDKGTGKVTFTFEGVNNMGDEIVYLSEYVKLASAVQVGTTVYGTFAEAFAAAQDGETVKLLSDFNLGLNDVVVNNAGQKVLANVDGKNITFDMNGKKITVDHRSTEAADRIYSVICVEDGAGLTVKGNGSIDVTTGVTDANVMPKVAYMFWKRGTTGYLVIEDGNYHMDNSEDSMVYTNGGNIVTVKGGTFTLDAVGTRLNGFPWVFNVAGNDAASLNVTGGTYNYDIRTQFWSQEVKLAEGLTMTNNADGTWTVVPAVASIVDGESYGSIQEAIDAAQDGETVKLLADVAYADADALSVEEKTYSTMLYVQGKNITLDLNGKNIDVEYTGSLLYSVVLVSDGAGLTVTGEGSINVRGLKADGTAAKNIAYVFWKRGTTGYLVIENGTFRMNDAADSMVYTNGDEIVTVNGGTFILDAVASQSNGWPVIFNTAGNNEQQIVVNGGTFNYNINYQMRPFEVSIAPQKALKKVQVDGVDMWTIVAAQAYVTEKLGDFVTDENGSYEHNVGYETIAEAFAAVKNGETVTIFAGEFTQNLTVNKGITVQGEVDENGNNLVTFNGKLSITADGATVENLNFNNSGTAAYVGAENVTIDGCSLVGSNGLYQSYTSGTVTFKNSYIKGGTYGIHFDGNAGGNIVIENCTVIGWTSFAAAINSVAISGTTFAEGNYNQLRLYQNAQFTDCTFNEKMNIDWGSSNKNAEFTNCSVEGDKDLTEIISLANIANKALEVTIDGERVCVAAKVDNKYYLALQAAIDAATEGQTVTILSDIALTEGVTVAADDNIFIDLNGKTVSMETAEAAVAALIKNNGTLTINSSVDGGKLSFLATAPSAANAYASNTISNYGTLTINAGTVENLSTGGACYALDNYAGSTATIIGGKLTAEKTAVRVFNWTNGEANAAELNVEGGEIISNDGYGININAGNAPYVALNISGGTITTNDTDYNLAVYVVNKNSAENFTANIEGGIFNGNLALNGVTSTTMAKGNVSVSGGTFDGVICYGEPACQFITGGSYKTEFTEDYLVYGYQLEANTETALYDANWTGRREVVTIVDGEVTEFDNEKDIEVGTLTYKRRFAAVNVWQPLYLPFEIPVSKLIELGYDVAYTNDVHLDDNEFDGVIDRIWVEYVGLKSGNLKAHFPYVVRATSPAALDLNLVFNDAMLRSTSENQIVLECSSAFYEFEFGGTYNIVNRNDLRENEETSCFALVVSSGNWAEFINDALTLNPFRVYMTMTAKAGSPVTISESAMKNIGSRLVGELNEDGTTTIYEVNAENGEEMIFDLSGRRVLETEKGIYIKDGKKIYVK